MTFDQRILSKLDEIHKEIDLIKQFIPNNDIVTNQRYCDLRTENGKALKMRGLREWFNKGCPRHDKHHVSISKVNKWAEEHFKPKGL